MFLSHYKTRMCRHQAWHVFRKWCFVATGERYHPHCARATAITRLLSDGVQIEIVQLFSRHKKIESVQVYDRRRKSVEDNPGLQLVYKKIS